MKIAELLQSYNKIAKNREYIKQTKSSAEKVAFVANPNVPPPQPGQPVQQGLPAGQQDPQQQAMMQQQQAAAQQQPAQQDPQQQAMMQQQPQQAPQAQGDANSNGTLMDEVMAAFQQLPPEAQQQVAPILQQLQGLPPEQREQHLSELLQQVAGAQQSQGQPQGQPQGMVAQAAFEDQYVDPSQQLGMDPSQQPAMDQAAMPMQDSQEQAAEDASQAEASAIEAKNELDNVKVTLSVRELLDLVGKGSATASLLKVKQLADTHQQKMEQTKQKAEADQQKAQQDQQAQQQDQGMMGGGIYPTPMGGAAQ